MAEGEDFAKIGPSLADFGRSPPYGFWRLVGFVIIFCYLLAADVFAADEAASLAGARR